MGLTSPPGSAPAFRREDEEFGDGDAISNPYLS